MSHFLLSQILVAIAIGFDLLSFQFKERKRIVACLACAGVLISSHFILLEQWTAAALMSIATVRYLTSVFTASRLMMMLFSVAALISTAFTYSGVLSLLSCSGSLVQTVAAFQRDDRRLRLLMIVGTSIWLLHNYLANSPVAVVMEALFISSNLVGYYRHYVRPMRAPA